MAKYYLFLDECGDQNLVTFDPSFPIFTLCGILIQENSLRSLEEKVNTLKQKYWGNRQIILHSRDIRKHERGFEILFNLSIKQDFYRDINAILGSDDYRIISCSIKKEPYIRKFGRSNDVYGQSLSFIMERTVFYLDSVGDDGEIDVVIEKRGKKEDQNLLAYYNRILDVGSYWVSPERMKKAFGTFNMRWKKEDVIGLQIADLVAYPLTRYVLNPQEVNLSYDIIEKNIYRQGDKLMGLRIYPKE